MKIGQIKVEKGHLGYKEVFIVRPQRNLVDTLSSMC